MDTNSDNDKQRDASINQQGSTSFNDSVPRSGDFAQNRTTKEDTLSAQVLDMPNPLIRFLFKLFLILLVISILLPFSGFGANILDFLQIPAIGIYRLVILTVLPFIFFILTILFGILSTKGSKEKTLWTMSLLGGSILAIFLVFNLASRVIPGLWVLDFLGIHLWAGAALAIICLLTSITGLLLSLFSRNARVNTLHKLLYIVFIATSIGAFLNFTVPILGYFNEQHESWKNYKPLNLPKTAEEWIAKYGNDYSLVRKNVDACNVADVTVEKVPVKNTNVQYLSIQLWSPQFILDPDTGKGSDRRYFNLQYKEKDRLETDMAAVSSQCPKTAQSSTAAALSPTPTSSTATNQTVVENCSQLPEFQSPPVLQYTSTYIFQSHEPAQKRITVAWLDNGVTMSPVVYKDELTAVDRNCKNIDIATLKSGDHVKFYLRVGYTNFYNNALVFVQKID